ncbi:MAG: Tex family protein [Zhongshania sp.]|uniref:Tex family protein n=1 Tax=Zhongshania sp. TaxID=1971902 RepID=UPI00263086D8|nr:Tex family protein [Zhongshania sp.]MDF1692570.1 Tex family protein [Zhongshania sp.]
MNSISSRIAQELGVKEAQVSAAVALLDEGATVPFISRYRKEVTGGLDDTQMRDLESRLGYLRELEDRRETILSSIREQDKLSPELERDIRAADTKNRLEDLYLPYKPKRRTKGQIAIEAGLEPLANTLFDDPNQEPASLALNYLNPELGINDVKGALDGAKYILMERLSEDANLLAKLRSFLWNECLLCSTVMTGKEQEGEKFRDYFAHSEPLKTTPSHRALAMFRGRNESILSLAIKFSEEEGTTHPCEGMVAEFWKVKDEGRPADTWLKEVIRWTWRIKLYTHLETDLLGQLRELADTAAIDVFAHNLKDLLLAAPAGQRATIGLDPGMRTGVKVAVIDATGKVVDHCAIFPTPPQNKIAESAAVLLALIKKHGVQLIAIGNGTASRETERFVKDVLTARPELGCTSVMVNESGASIYSASEYAAKEFPDLDVTIRGAISIARRLQDPLAELVKIDPKSIGVGQYQHDVSQTALSRTLETVVEDCVNAVGVDVNTASPALLARVSGLNQSISANIVEYRDRNGAFKSREQLKEVNRFGAKTFEQAAGFLRVVGGDNPLDASAVHPESYSVVEKIVNRCGREVKNVLGDSSFLKTLKPAEYADERFGIPTVTDIFAELDKPGRDPRPDFKTATFKDGIEKISDLEPDMILEGVVTNVTNFGAFVDIGVHQDGLVHISALANQFVKDPHSVVKAGDIVKVKVMEVDAQRKRIALSMRLEDKASEVQAANSSGERRGARNKPAAMPKQPQKAENTTMAALFAQAKQKKR